MNIPLVVSIGTVLGFAGAAGIYFDPRVPGKRFIVAAGALRGSLVSLLAGLSMSAQSGWLVGCGLGALFGALSGVLICLSKGTAVLEHAKYILPTAAVTGALSGALIAWLAL